MISSPKSAKKESALSSLTASAMAAIITGLIGFAVSTFLGLADDLKSVAVGVSVLVGVMAIEFIKRRILTFSDDLGLRYMRERIGIIRVYDNLESCKDDLQADFEKAKDVRLLLQIARREFGDGEKSYFLPVAKKKDPGCRIRVLRASPESPFLSRSRAQYRYGSEEPWKVWQEDISRLRGQIDLLRTVDNVKIEDRVHEEPFLWRIFLFDDVAYVSGYIYQKDNDRQAVVYKFRKGDLSLYSVFNKYFEYLWRKYDPSASTDLKQAWADWV